MTHPQWEPTPQEIREYVVGIATSDALKRVLAETANRYLNGDLTLRECQRETLYQCERIERIFYG